MFHLVLFLGVLFLFVFFVTTGYGTKDKKTRYFDSLAVIFIIGFVWFMAGLSNKNAWHEIWFLPPIGFLASFWFGHTLKEFTARKKKTPIQAKFVVLFFITSGLFFTGCFKEVRPQNEVQNIKQELKAAKLGDFVLLKNELCLVESHDVFGDAVIKSKGSVQSISLSDEWMPYVKRVIHRKDRKWSDAAYNYIVYNGYNYGRQDGLDTTRANH